MHSLQLFYFKKSCTRTKKHVSVLHTPRIYKHVVANALRIFCFKNINIKFKRCFPSVMQFAVKINSKNIMAQNSKLILYIFGFFRAHVVILYKKRDEKKVKEIKEIRNLRFFLSCNSFRFYIL